MEKNWYKSKTLWLNVAAIAVVFFPGLKDQLSPEAITGAMGALNMILRVFFTSSKLVK